MFIKPETCAWNASGTVFFVWNYTFMTILNPILFVFRGSRRTKSISYKVCSRPIFVLCSQAFHVNNLGDNPIKKFSPKYLDNLPLQIR